MNTLERLAKISGCSSISFDTILNDYIFQWAKKQKYQRQTGSRNAVKYL